MNLSEIVDRFAADLPDHPALVFGEQTVSYAELLHSINKLANALIRLEVNRGDRVAIIMPNRPEFIISYLAVIRIGAIAVTLNPASTAYELSHYFIDAKPVVVLCTGDQVIKIESLKDRSNYLRNIVSTDSTNGSISFRDILSDASDNYTAVDLNPDDSAVTIFTAGLLGRALGATLSHGNLDSQANLLWNVCGKGPETRGLALIPMYHAFGAAVNFLNTLKAGGTVYLVERVDFPKLIPWLKEARITFAGVVPMVTLWFAIPSILQRSRSHFIAYSHQWRRTSFNGNLRKILRAIQN